MKGNFTRCSLCTKQIKIDAPRIRVVETLGGGTSSHNYSGRATGINYCKPCWAVLEPVLKGIPVLKAIRAAQ